MYGLRWCYGVVGGSLSALVTSRAGGVERIYMIYNISIFKKRRAHILPSSLYCICVERRPDCYSHCWCGVYRVGM